jgi:predicted esterase YcpF (UPF0227 family)
MLYYIHGYQSSPQGDKAVLFKQTLHAIPITYRTCPPEDLTITDALDRIRWTIHGDHSIGLIGSSLGGFLAAATALDIHDVRKLALINPATIPPDTDLASITDMPQRILQAMIRPDLFSRRIPAEILILRGTRDDVVPDKWVQDFARAQHATIMTFDDDHRLSRSLPKLPGILAGFFSDIK